MDTLGLILALVVHAASVQDRDGAKLVLRKLRPHRRSQRRCPRLVLVWADASYAGQLVAWVQRVLKLRVEIVSKQAGQRTFVVLPRRWVVERTFAWMGRYRRLSKDYEQNTKSSEAWIYLAMIHLMTRRLAKP